MDNRDTRIAAALERLFRTYPQSDRGDAGDVTRERVERFKIYVEALGMYDIRDIEAAVQSFLSGSAPGVNAAFLPAAPMVAAETRRLMNLRVDRENLDRRLHPALPPPDVERSPESRARVKALIDSAVTNLAAKSLDDPLERHRKRIARTNERFDRDPYFEVGDPEDHEDAA